MELLYDTTVLKGNDHAYLTDSYGDRKGQLKIREVELFFDPCRLLGSEYEN